MQGEKTQMEAELERYRECDPGVIEGLKQEIKVAKEASNRWTGNLCFSVYTCIMTLL